MSRSKEEINKEKRCDIIKILKWFDLEISPSDIQRLEHDNNIVFSTYLDPYLQPCIPILYEKKIEGILWDNKEGIQFKGLISLCFSGHVSQKTWDIIWSYLTEEEKIVYTATTYHLGFPLEIATKAGNLEGIKRLERIYQELLPKYPKYKYKVHWHLRTALLRSNGTSENEQQCLAYLLKICDQFAKTINTKDSRQRFSNKQLAYTFTAIMLEEGATTLLDMFSEVCEESIDNRNEIPIWHIYSYLKKQGITNKEFSYFNGRVKKKLETVLNDDTCNTIKEIIEEAEGIVADEPKKKPASLTDSPDTLFNSKPANPQIPKDNAVSNLTSEQIADINTLIEQLEGEIQSCWLFPNKDRKAQKVSGLQALLIKAQTLDIKTAIQEVEQEFPEIRKGDFSTRTKDLLDALERDGNSLGSKSK